MLTLMPLNPIQSALKRRNSKSYDFSRRGSLSTYSTYSLPNSKTSMRRFSSYEELAPIFQLLSSSSAPPPQEKPAKTNSHKPVRRSSMSMIIRRDSKVSRKNSRDSDPCAQLDAQLARIKSKLSQFKNEDLELSHRVDDLTSSVQEIYDGRVARPIRNGIARLKSEKRDRPLSAVVAFRREPSPNLQAIAESHLESSSDSEDDDEQSYQEYCRNNLSKLAVKSKTQKTSINFSALDVVDSNTDETTQPQEQRKHYLLNNTVRPKAKSSPVLSMVRNDLTQHDFDSQSKRLSVISSQSDSVIITQDYHPSSLSFEKTAEAL